MPKEKPQVESVATEIETEVTQDKTEETKPETEITQNETDEAQTETVQARVLGGFTLDGVQYEPDDVIEGTTRLIKSLGSSVDADPEAVNHCFGLEKPVIKRHVPKQAAQELTAQ